MPARGPSATWFGTVLILLAVIGCAPEAGVSRAGERARTPGTPAAAAPTRVAAATIVLPGILAVELPSAEMTAIAPDTAPLRDLLAGASAGGLKVTHDQAAPLAVGATRVTWTAWEGEPERSAALARRAAHVYVLPHGQTPAGVSWSTHATAGNNAAHVVRDAGGKVHVAWFEHGPAARQHRVAYRRGAHDPATGVFRWETEPLRVSDASSETDVSFVAIEASAGAVHFAWWGGRTARYRRLMRQGDGWSFEPIRDTGAIGGTHDRGPDLAVRGDDEVHIVTPFGHYAVSRTGGRQWALEQVPLAGPGHRKNMSLAVDSGGHAHVVFTQSVRSPAQWSGARPNGGYWQLRYVRRAPGGGWVDAQDVLAAFPEWGDGGPARDRLADWADVAVDARGTIHLAWHGTASSGIYGRDEAYYLRRRAAAPGVWGAWETPRPLHPVDPRTGDAYSFAPSLAVDPSGDVALAVVFFEYGRLPREVFDVDVVAIRSAGASGAPLSVSRLARAALDAGRPADALSTWFPSANPRFYRDAAGRVWLDVLHTHHAPPTHGAPSLVVYQRLAVTELVSR